MFRDQLHSGDGLPGADDLDQQRRGESSAERNDDDVRFSYHIELSELAHGHGRLLHVGSDCGWQCRLRSVVGDDHLSARNKGKTESIIVKGTGARQQKQFLVILTQPTNAIAIVNGYPARGTGVINP